MKIFVIEDDLGWGHYYERLLRKHELEIFHDALAAMEALADCDEDGQRPALIILDLLLTGPTGFAVLNELQSNPGLADIPVAIVSSVALPAEDTEALRAYGVRWHLDKATMAPTDILKIVQGLEAER